MSISSESLVKLGKSARRIPFRHYDVIRSLYHTKSGFGRPDGFTARQFQKKQVIKPKSNNKGLLEWYSRKLDTHPILTKAISSAVICGSGDILSQYIEASKNKKSFKWDHVRTSRFGCLGIFLIGPVIHFWYGAVMRLFPGTSVSTVIKRVALDQFVFSPMFLPTFLSGLWTLEGKSFEEILPALQDTVPAAIIANWILWIPAQIVNFRFVPAKYQVLFSNITGFFWNAYLSYAAHSGKSSPSR